MMAGEGVTTGPTGAPGPLVLALVGLGPRGAGLLERLVSNAAEGVVGGADQGRIEVHVIDPFPAGGGRVWRDTQSGLLRLNTTTEDLTAFVDDSVVMEGPVTPGPTLFEWCGTYGVDLTEPALAAEAAALGPMDFPTRRLASAYFGFALDRTRRRAPDWLTIVSHAQPVVDLLSSGSDTERDVVVLEDGQRIDADAVVLLNGHVDVRPAPEHARLMEFADDHRLTYLPPGYGGDLDLTSIEAGQDTIVRGFGLGFVDLMILLTEGRGGRFVPAGDRLRYLCSGREPRLLVGSRRGVPYHAKPMYRLQVAKPSTPTFCTTEAVTSLVDRGTPITFWSDLWPLIGREVTWAYYVELALGHPARVRGSWSEFATTYAELPWGSPAYDRWISTVVPDPADRLDLLALDRPLGGRAVTDRTAFSEMLRDHIRADLARRTDVGFSADLGAFHALLMVLPIIGPALGSALMDPHSLIDDVLGWFMGFFSFYASGPPPDRLEQLLALEEAGVVSFLGAELQISTDRSREAFVARSASVDGEVLAPALIDATLPAFDLDRSLDPLLSSLASRGETAAHRLTDAAGRRLDTGQVQVDASYRLVRADGTSARRTFALGMHTMIKSAAFARPGSNGPVHRQNDHLARTLLALPPAADPGHGSRSPGTTTRTHLEPSAALSGTGGR